MNSLICQDVKSLTRAGKSKRFYLYKVNKTSNVKKIVVIE